MRKKLTKFLKIRDKLQAFKNFNKLQNLKIFKKMKCLGGNLLRRITLEHTNTLIILINIKH